MQLQHIIPTSVYEKAQEIGITLDPDQLHIGGERSLHSPHKLVLTGYHNVIGKKIIFKYADTPSGQRELRLEYRAADQLRDCAFALEDILLPNILHFEEKAAYSLLITQFIEQPKIFTAFTLKEQFFMAVQALENQESFHATTLEHHQYTRRHFVHYSPADYLTSLQTMIAAVEKIDPKQAQNLEPSWSFLSANLSLLKTYDGYLMHTDFVPHNFRINDNKIYLLDTVSFKIGSKYESWARFINFMEIHNPLLVTYLLNYVRDDRGLVDYQALRLMRIYKSVFLVHFYATMLDQTEGDLHQLTRIRLGLWTTITAGILSDTALPADIREQYYQHRDQLRSNQEKKRQSQFTWL